MVGFVGIILNCDRCESCSLKEKVRLDHLDVQLEWINCSDHQRRNFKEVNLKVVSTEIRGFIRGDEELAQTVGVSELLFWRANVANLLIANWHWPLNESRNLIGGLLGYVCQHDLFICVQISNMTNVWHESSNGLTLMFLYSFNDWTQIVQLPVFR